MNSSFASSMENERKTENFFLTQQHSDRLFSLISKSSCTCWRGNTRAVIACQTCRRWSIVLTRMEGL